MIPDHLIDKAVIYRPVLVGTEAQAEALDGKTPIQIVLNRTREVYDVKLSEDFPEDFWPDALEPGNRWAYVALVPIEARRQHGHDIVDEKLEVAPSARAHRYVTHWEEA